MNPEASQCREASDQAIILKAVQTKSKIMDGIRRRQEDGDLTDRFAAAALQRIGKERKAIQAQLNPLILASSDGKSCRGCAHYSLGEDCFLLGRAIDTRENRSPDGPCGPEAAFYESY